MDVTNSWAWLRQQSGPRSHGGQKNRRAPSGNMADRTVHQHLSIPPTHDWFGVGVLWGLDIQQDSRQTSVARLDLCVLSSFAARTQGGIRFISAVEAASPSRPLDQPCSVRFSRPWTAQPVTEHHLAAQLWREVDICPHLLKKAKARVSNLPDNMWAGQRLDVPSVNQIKPKPSALVL